MTAAPAAEPDWPPLRPNPFAFPSDTTFRFALLVAAVLGATLYVWDWMWTVLGADADEVTASALQCLQESQQGIVGAGNDPLLLAQASDGFRTCVQETYRDATWWMVAGVILVLAVGAVLTIAWPRAKERRAGFRPLEAEDAPDVLATLSELSREAGLRHEPRWVWNPLRREATGVAFGHPGRYAVGLTGGLVVRHATDPDGFRAIVRHELAHIRNRDVGLTYATLALWYAFLLAAVVPFAFTLLDEGEFALSLTWRLLALAALVYLTRNAVLRSREIYADLRASTTDGPHGALERIVGSLRGRSDRLPGRLLALHPSPETARRRASRYAAALLDRPDRGVRRRHRGNDQLRQCSDAGRRLRRRSARHRDGRRRRIRAARGRRDRRRALARPVRRSRERNGVTGRVAAWARARRRVVGRPRASLASALPGEDRGLLGDLLHGESLLWVAALVALVLLLFYWVADGASVWLRTEAARRSPDAWTAGLLIAAGVFTIVFGAFYTLRQLSEGITFSKLLTAEQHRQVSDVAAAGPRWLWQLVMDPQTLLLISRPLIPAAILLLWIFPLAAVLVRRRRTGEAPWAYLDSGGRLEPDRPQVSVLRPLAVGVLGGLACLLGYTLYRAGIHTFVSTDTRDRDEFVLSFFFWQLVIALVAQAAAGGTAAALARDRTRLAEALCAATVTGSIAVFGIVAGPVAGGCVDPLSIRPGPCTWDVSADFTWDVWRQAITQGAAVAVLAGLAVIGTDALLRTRAPSVADAAAKLPPGG